LQPSLHRTLKDLAAERVREVCVVPISFVSDHVETLGEIDHEAREEARRLGIRHFEMSAGLNDSPKFIQALSELVLKALGKESTCNNSMAASEGDSAAPTLLVAG
jgi:ferrochelatase